MRDAEFEAKLEELLIALEEATRLGFEIADGIESRNMRMSQEFRLFAISLISLNAALSKGDMEKIAEAISDKLAELIHRSESPADTAVSDLIRGIDGIRMN